MPNSPEKEVCKQIGGHTNPLTGECDFSDYERNVAICSYLLPILGLLLLLIRLASIPDFAEIQHTSNFLVIIASLSLIFQLRSTFLNSILMTSMVLIVGITIIDTVSFFSGVDASIWTLTYHIPPFVIGMIIFLRRYEMTNLVSVVFGGISLLAWLLFVDRRTETISMFYWVAIVYSVASVLMAIDLYRNGAINGILSESLCEVKM